MGHRLLTVILNWRTPDMTLKAVAAARAAMTGIAGEIVIVDNDSGDGSEARLREAMARQTGVRVVQSGRNGGFGAGNNAGIAAALAGGDFDLVYVLNSDAFPAPDAIRALIDHLDAHPEAGFAGSAIIDPGGHTHVTAFRFPSIASEFEGAVRLGPVSRLLRGRQVHLPVPDTARRVDWLAGASLMMRRAVLDEIGLFDEAFFLYFEETDLCLRAARAGWQTHYVPASRVEHIGSVSTGMKAWRRVPEYWFDSRRHYFRKNHGAAYEAAATAAHVAGGALHRLRCLLTGRRPADPPHFLRTLMLHAWAGRRRAAPAAIPRIARLTGA
ncbi:glycosyltransferase [Wenxinia marina]|uniref:Putative glycosyltransferase n=1 Tax=Wenxinia marina DSM 24838 TaxID=1123501 RepID=A0A0D0NRP6_9RHOB|nr:glycosyltransferase [Wenxinia marina]KIQ70910.1 putative glycosyltransferase [Wenxinia marina DSM 24838]GGL56361.1 glycosyl transferase [Wenxinia marina]